MTKNKNADLVTKGMVKRVIALALLDLAEIESIECREKQTLKSLFQVIDQLPAELPKNKEDKEKEDTQSNRIKIIQNKIKEKSIELQSIVSKTGNAQKER